MHFTSFLVATALAAGIYAAPTAPNTTSTVSCAAQCTTAYQSALSAKIYAGIDQSDANCKTMNGYAVKGSWSTLDQSLVVALDLQVNLLNWQNDACIVAADYAKITAALARLNTALLGIQPCLLNLASDFGKALTSLNYASVTTFVATVMSYITIFTKYSSSQVVGTLKDCLFGGLTKAFTAYFATLSTVITTTVGSSQFKQLYSMLYSLVAILPFCPCTLAILPNLLIALGQLQTQMMAAGIKFLAQGGQIVFG